LPGQGIKALIAIRDAKHHAVRRRPWTRAFNSASVKDYEWIAARRTSQLIDALEATTRTVDLALWISYFA
jgi:cytochrome P450